jgi:Asp-tRNA(Asn)/Glu-tRNA(Gln) amidotransferase A subunit family amidase
MLAIIRLLGTFVADLFAPKASPEQIALLNATQRPIAVACIQERSPKPAWTDKPSWYLIAEEDRMIPLATQRYLAVVAAVRPRIKTYPADVVSRALLQRATVVRQWQLFLNKYAVLLIPVSAELPFPDGLDLQGNAAIQRVWDAQFLLRATPVLGLPALAVSTGLVGQTPVGVQIVASRYREDLCLRAGEAIEARGTPPAPIDPRN